MSSKMDVTKTDQTYMDLKTAGRRTGKEPDVQGE